MFGTDCYKNHSDLEVVTAYIGEEIGKPSETSGIDPDSINDISSWLIEPRRSSDVTYFSGTLEHPSYRSDLLGATVVAFAHFVYEFSSKQVVIADLQGMHATLIFSLRNH